MNKKRRKRNRQGILIIVFIIVLSLILIVYNNRSFLRPIQSGKSVTIHQFESGQISKFAPIRDKVAVVDTEGITFVTQSGGSSPKPLAQMGNPVLQTEGNYTLIYDKDGKALETFEGEAKKANIVSQQPILTAKINSRGYIAVVTNDAGYKALIQVYDSQGGLIYEWHLGESYVLDVDISANGKNIAAATMATNEGVVSGNLVVANIESEKVIGETKRSNTVLFAVKYLKNNHIVAIGDQEMLGFNGNGEKQWELSYEGRTLQSYKLQTNNNILLAFTGTRNNSELEVYGTNGKKRGTYISESLVKTMDMYKGDIIVAEKREVKLLNHKGTLKATATSDKEIRQVMMLPYGKVAVVCGNTVDVLKP